MKAKLFITITAMLIFGIGFAVYAYNSTTTYADSAAASCCCCSGDSCPMKSAEAKAGEAKADAAHSCCSCCGDSCPMKAGQTKAGMKHDGTAVHKMAPGEKHEMKGDAAHSCPMMKDGDKAEHLQKMSGEAHKRMDHSKMDGHAGCSCPCCGKAKEKKATAAI